MLPLALPVALVVSASTALAAAQPSPEPPQPATDWWRSAVFYEIFVRSFADSTQGPLADDGVGDLRGLIERLDYLNDADPTTTDDLGVTGIWLMPICESPSYHGYDVVDYRSVDAEYGTNEDFKALVAECHKRGIRVIVDTVINHVGIDHPWFQQAIDPASPTHDWFVWSDQPLTGPGAPQHPVWHDKVKDRAGQYYYGFFWHGMPDVNLRSRAATQAVRDYSRFWVNDLGADGLRLDAVKHLIEDGVQFENTPETIAWLDDYERYMHSIKPGVFLVGEIWDSTDVVARYLRNGIDSAFEFTTCFAIEKGINAGKAPLIAEALQTAWTDLQGRQSTMIGNHDMDRVLNRLGENVDKARCAATIQLTTPGTPFIYYGEEIGMLGAKPDPEIRKPMQWTSDPTRAGFTTAAPWKPVDASTAATNVERQTQSPSSLLSLYRRLIALRQSEPALAVGDFTLLDAGNDKVLVFIRTHESQRRLVLVNVSGQQLRDDWHLDAPSLGLTPGADLKELLHDVLVYPPTKGEEADWRPLGVLDPYTGYVVELPSTAP